MKLEYEVDILREVLKSSKILSPISMISAVFFSFIYLLIAYTHDMSVTVNLIDKAEQVPFWTIFGTFFLEGAIFFLVLSFLCYLIISSVSKTNRWKDNKHEIIPLTALFWFYWLVIAWVAYVNELLIILRKAEIVMPLTLWQFLIKEGPLLLSCLSLVYIAYFLFSRTVVLKKRKMHKLSFSR